MVEKGLTGLRKRYRVLHGNEPSTSRGSISLNLKESLFLEQRYLENISFFTEYRDIHFLDVQLLSESLTTFTQN